MQYSAPITLAGKDYLSVAEAAVYCCVSDAQFRRTVKDDPDWQKLPKLKIMGKIAYRKIDLERMIERTNAPVKLPKRLSACR